MQRNQGILGSVESL
jgi:hypothetical protein